MRTALLFLFVFLASIYKCHAQTNCNEAVQQLQSYAKQINQLYNAEYWNIIPNQRCPAANAYGQQFNPALVQQCRIQMLTNLNNWYAQQCNYVNNCYAQITSSCTNQANAERPAPVDIAGTSNKPRIDTKSISDLQAGIDDNKTVRITIPDTAEGFQDN